ncbi:MAG: ABC transporter permease [Promicromonosporaceae bacterium]|nr:ABC transporter permease [Promicromonosporaceae bacterium]
MSLADETPSGTLTPQPTAGSERQSPGSRPDASLRPLEPSAGGPDERVPGAFGRLLRSELRLVLGRRRNVILLSGLAAVPLLLALVLFLTRSSQSAGEGPGFVGRVTENGLFLVVAAIFVCLPFLLPLTIAIASGDAIAGEASAGTLRYLLVVPVPRTRLLVVKALAALAFAGSAVLAIAIVGLVAGAGFFGLHDVVLLSGDTVSLGAGALRIAGVVVYVALSMTGLVAVGLFFSTLTEVPVAAMAATVITAIVSGVLDALPALHAIHPWLLTHHWLDFAELLRIQPDWRTLASGLGVQAAWIVIFSTLAWARFTSADVSS